MIECQSDLKHSLKGLVQNNEWHLSEFKIHEHDNETIIFTGFERGGQYFSLKVSKYEDIDRNFIDIDVSSYKESGVVDNSLENKISLVLFKVIQQLEYWLKNQSKWKFEIATGQCSLKESRFVSYIKQKYI
jgi:hypothetical protein